jgi:hypothetical protein
MAFAGRCVVYAAGLAGASLTIYRLGGEVPAGSRVRVRLVQDIET